MQTNMTVDKLIVYLREIVAADPRMGRAIVVLARDGEGNRFSPLKKKGAISDEGGRYQADTDWSGVFTTEGDQGVRAICLWPAN